MRDVTKRDDLVIQANVHFSDVNTVRSIIEEEMGNILPDARTRCDKCDNVASVTYTVSGTEEEMKNAFPNGYSVMRRLESSHGSVPNLDMKLVRESIDRPETTFFRCADHPFESHVRTLKVKTH